MRQRSLWILWGLASAYGLWWGVRLAFFPTGMQATVQATAPGMPSAPEVITPTYSPELGIPILIALLLLYAWLGHALYSRQYKAFRAVAIFHVVLSILGASIGWLFLPSSTLLLAAIIVAGGSGAQDERPGTLQR